MSSDRWSGILLFLLSLYICLESSRLGLGAYSRPGPGFLPFYSGLLLAVLSLALICVGLRAAESSEESWRNSLNIVLVSLSLFAFALLLEPLGFIAAAFLFATFVFKAVERRAWSFALAAAVLISGASYVIFERWLQAQLPAGLLGG